MMTIYPQAKEAWYDYYNNGFQHISKGTFMQDFIAFFKKQNSDSHFECFNKFYEEKFPHFTIIQMLNYHKNLSETEFNIFFECSPSKIQKDFIDFCYVSIEEHYFAPESLWIMPQDAIPQDNLIDLTGDYGDMPALEAHPPAPPGEEVEHSNVWGPQQDSQIYDEDSSDEETDDEMPALVYDIPQLEHHPGEEVSNVFNPNYWENIESQLFDEDSSDEMPPLIDFEEKDDEIPQLEGNPIAISGFMTAEMPVLHELFSDDEMPSLQSDEETTFDEMPSLESDYEIVD